MQPQEHSLQPVCSQPANQSERPFKLLMVAIPERQHPSRAGEGGAKALAVAVEHTSQLKQLQIKSWSQVGAGVVKVCGPHRPAASMAPPALLPELRLCPFTQQPRLS